MTTATQPTDAQIQDHRTLMADVLGCPELVAMRRGVRELYADQADAARSAAATARHLGGRAAASVPSPRDAAASDEAWARYEHLSRDTERSSKRIAETQTHADEAFRAWGSASAAYEKRRRELLDAAGADEAIAGMELSEARARREALEDERLNLPPVGWGEKRYPELDARVAAWQTRPAFERLTNRDERVRPTL